MRAPFCVLTAATAAALVFGCGGGGGGGDDDDDNERPDARVEDEPDAAGDPDATDADAASPDGAAGLTVAIAAPVDGEPVIGAREVTVTGTVSGGPDSVTVAVDDDAPVAATIEGDAFSAAVTLPDGAATITVTATRGDEAATDTVSVTYPFVTLTTYQTASLVLGQRDAHSGAADADPVYGVSWVYGNATWGNDTLFVPSSGYNRILAYRGFPARDGEPGDFAVLQPTLVDTDASSGPDRGDWVQTAVFHDGRLYVNEWTGSRIMGWSTPPTTSGVAADFVIGQAALDAVVTGCSRSLTNFPDAFSINHGRLFVADRYNHRVLIWNTVPIASGVEPDLVLGQGDFEHCAADDDDQDGAPDVEGPSARTLDDPIGVYFDGTRLFVVDKDNHRVLTWSTLPTASFTPADVVLGQASMTTQTASTTASGMNSPVEIAGNGNQLAVADAENNRVLVWNTIPSSAVEPDVILGQPDATTATANGDGDLGISGRTLHHPTGVAFVRDTLIVSDQDNARLLVYGPLPCPAGQYEPPGQIGTCADDPCQPDPCDGGAACWNDTGAAVCE